MSGGCCLCTDLEKNDPPLFSFGCNIWRKNTLCWLITFSSSKALKDWGERAVKFVCPHCNRRLVQHPLRWNSFLQFTSVHFSNWFLVCLCLVLVESSPPTHCDGTHSGPEVVVVAVLPPLLSPLSCESLTNSLWSPLSRSSILCSLSVATFLKQNRFRILFSRCTKHMFSKCFIISFWYWMIKQPTLSLV